MKVVLEKARKNKPRVQKMPSHISSKLFNIKPPTSMKPIDVGKRDGSQEEPPTDRPSSWKERLHMPKQVKQLFAPSRKRKDSPGGEESERLIKDSDSDDDEPLLNLTT